MAAIETLCPLIVPVSMAPSVRSLLMAGEVIVSVGACV